MKKRILLAALVAIGGCKQDPYDGYSDEIKNGKPPGVSKPTPPAAFLDAVLDAPPMMSFGENVESKFKITARLLNADPKTPYKIRILSGPKDANYDEKTSQLVWTPPAGTTGTAYFISDSLTLRVETTSSPYMLKDFPIGYIVTKATQTPEILKVEGLERQLIEGENRSFRVVVRDVSANSNLLPKLMVLAPDPLLKQNGSPYLQPTLIAPVTGQNGVWNFNFTVAGTDPVTKEPVEMTRGITGFSFILRAVSAVGILSQDLEGKFTVVNVARKPIVSFGTPGNFSVKPGEKLTLAFSVLTRTSDGNLTITFPTVPQIPGATVNCVKVNTNSDQHECTLVWQVPTDPAQTAASYNLRVSVLNSVAAGPGLPPTTAQTDADRVIQVIK